MEESEGGGEEEKAQRKGEGDSRAVQSASSVGAVCVATPHVTWAACMHD